jgi:hypothetical protein
MLEADATKLAERITTDFAGLEVPPEQEWLQSSAAKTIDCVLSLRKKYNGFVVPRVKQFTSDHPEVTTCADLRSLIDSFKSKELFLAEVLRMNSVKRAATLSGVVDYLLGVQPRFEGADEATSLRAWAVWARPGDYLAVDVKYFGLAGFQYLRMLFGADTIKPDVHTIRYISEAVGRTVTDAQAIYIAERAGELIDQPVRALDAAIWERGSGQALGG